MCHNNRGEGGIIPGSSSNRLGDCGPPSHTVLLQPQFTKCAHSLPRRKSFGARKNGVCLFLVRKIEAADLSIKIKANINEAQSADFLEIVI